MRKFFAVFFATLITFVGVAPAKATTSSTIVIIDSGFNLSQISNNVVQEVCITISSGCNNGTNFEVGPGSAQTSITIAPRFVSDWGHGTMMASDAIGVNPNIDLIVIRNAKVYSTGNLLYGGESTLQAALQWVLDNKTTYNISGVLMSRGSHTYAMNDSTVRGLIIQAQIYSTQLDKMQSNTSLFRASIAKFTKIRDQIRTTLAGLPNIACPATSNTVSLIEQLKTNNIASIFATGNDYNNRFVDSPACVDSAIAVTAFDANNKILQRANVAPNTDFATIATSTSQAAALFAGKWSLVYNGNYETTYSSIKNSGVVLDRYNVVGVN